MSENNNIIRGPKKNSHFPPISLGKLYYDELKKKDPNTVILVDKEINEEITYGKLLQVSVSFAKKLAKVGVKLGDVITIVSENNWKYVPAIISSLFVGATVNCLNSDYKINELQHLLTTSKPSVIFCTNKTLINIIALKEKCVYSGIIILLDGKPKQGILGFEDLLIDDGNNFEPVNCNPQDEVAFILTSSGTTGFPKGVVLTHENIKNSLVYVGDNLIMDLNEKQTVICYLPMFHIYGLLLSIGGVLFGSKLLILNKFKPDLFLQIIQDYKVSRLFVVPPILLFLVKSPLVNNYNISSIQDVFCGAALISKELEELAEKRLKVHCVRQIYGMTETSGLVTVIWKEKKKTGSVGQIIYNCDIKVCDPETGRILGSNQVGEICIKSIYNMKEYKNNEEQTRDSIDEDGYFKSGDLGYYDEDKFFFIVGRLKEIIKYKGFQVSPAELENHLLKHPAVKDAGVIGKPDEKAGEVPVAFVVRQPDREVSENELIHYVEEHLSVQKRLYGGVIFVDEIPKNPSGKILRQKLQELL